MAKRNQDGGLRIEATVARDAMGHSYASYWLALHQNRAQLAELMGNSVEIIRKHYRQPLLRSEAVKFWSIGPVAASVELRDPN